MELIKTEMALFDRMHTSSYYLQNTTSFGHHLQCLSHKIFTAAITNYKHINQLFVLHLPSTPVTV